MKIQIKVYAVFLDQTLSLFKIWYIFYYLFTYSKQYQFQFSHLQISSIHYHARLGNKGNFIKIQVNNNAVILNKHSCFFLFFFLYVVVLFVCKFQIILISIYPSISFPLKPVNSSQLPLSLQTQLLTLIYLAGILLHFPS